MSLREKIERVMMAVSFAEAGDHDTARQLLKEKKRIRKHKRPSQRPRQRMELRAPGPRR
ncbi:MAG: hypothetical protein JRJ12_04030 [Deltaproteobacteria bacterium]|nr:hypothetical protein [Deltaproteobacteria bacterium]MBW2070954.1 hypothetical protein [Deltaproteobacteria bacterium]